MRVDSPVEYTASRRANGAVNAAEQRRKPVQQPRPMCTDSLNIAVESGMRWARTAVLRSSTTQLPFLQPAGEHDKPRALWHCLLVRRCRCPCALNGVQSRALLSAPD
jgi:hypothetical protein